MLDLASKNNVGLARGWWLDEPASARLAFGVVLHQIGGAWTVARSLIGSPAETAGLVTGVQVLSIDGYDVGIGKGDPYELQVLLQTDTAKSHRVIVRSGTTESTNEIEKRPLRALLEYDYDNGGATLRACVGCRTCRPLTIGATDCTSGCPGNYCTIG
jgi:hypothetical protein